MHISEDDFIRELERETSLPGRQVMPKLKGLYRAMISVRAGFWDPKARRTKEDFAALSPTKLISPRAGEGVIRESDRPRFQNWFLIDSAPWPDSPDKPEHLGAKELLTKMRADPRWSSARSVFAESTIQRGGAVQEEPTSRRDKYADALLALLRCKDEIQSDLARRASGIYAVFRPSIVYPTRYVRGLMACFIDAGTHSLRTLEVHRMTKGDSGFASASSAGDPEDVLAQAAPELEDILQGCMVQKSRIIQIHAVDLITRSFNITYLRTALRGPAFPGDNTTDPDSGRFAVLDDDRAMGVPPTRAEGARRVPDLVSPFEVLSGVTSGIVGGAFFAYPCVYSRLGPIPGDRSQGHKPSSMFAHLREMHGHVPALVDTVPAFVLEQLRLNQPPPLSLPHRQRRRWA